MILLGIVVATLLWANPRNPYVWIVLAVTLGFGLVGFYDDYLKVTRQTHSGFAGAHAARDRGRDRARRLLRDREPRPAGVRHLAGVSGVQGHGHQPRLVLSDLRAPSSSSAPATR